MVPWPDCATNLSFSSDFHAYIKLDRVKVQIVPYLT